MSQRGKLYADALSRYIKEQNIEGLRVWTSWLKRTIQTVAGIPVPQERWKALNEIDAGALKIIYHDKMLSKKCKLPNLIERYYILSESNAEVHRPIVGR